MKEFIEILAERIIEVYNKDNLLQPGNYGIRMFRHKYSSQPKESITLFIDEKSIPRDSGYKVKYLCNCGEKSVILLAKYIVKYKMGCKRCAEDLEKRTKQSIYMKNTFEENGKILKKVKPPKPSYTNRERIEMSKLLFESESEEFKEHFYSIGTTIEEFDRHKNAIVSINGVNINDIEFIPCLSISNLHKYSQYILDKTSDKIFKFGNLVYNCSCCSEIFVAGRSRLPKERLCRYKILCKGCNLSNKSFKVRPTYNISGEIINYQSNPELDLIDFYNSNNIIISNGPNIDFKFDNKDRKYRVDFYIKSFNMLIEIKDNHIWHRKQVESGIWQAKENSAKKYCVENDLEYKLIFTKEMNNFKELLRYSLGLYESTRS